MGNVQVDWKAATVMKKAAPYQETSSRLWKSVVICGMAVATIVYRSHSISAMLHLVKPKQGVDGGVC